MTSLWFPYRERGGKYEIKKIATPVEGEVLIDSLKNGHRPLITIIKDGEDVILHL
ncbi:MAG: hypothetical protein JWR02_1512 [Mucilaginibacter sp.]|nr:hypothetical protein [Mucilaginibacter sp.]